MTSRLSKLSLTLFLSLPVLTNFAGAQTAPQSPNAGPIKFDSGTISGLPARNIGSAEMSGRIAAVAAVNEGGQAHSVRRFGERRRLEIGQRRDHFQAGLRQSDGPIHRRGDHRPVQSQDRLGGNWRESWLRNSVSIGDGIYKSVDGGENWTNIGLKDSEHIAKILVDPTDSDTVFACATGQFWDDNAERGVYKTTDGGKSWRKVLGGANGSTGCAMLSMNKAGAKTIYAAMWDFRRQAWTFRSGGPGSGLFKSTDGGEHWTEFTPANAKGLPEKPYGRIAVAVAPSKPQVVYAMIESKSSALFRSDDGGANWTRSTPANTWCGGRSISRNLIVDPKDENKVFKVDARAAAQRERRQELQPGFDSAHGDFHDVWIDRRDPNLIFACDDGGLWRSQDGGTRWEHMMNLPVSQFYHVSVDKAEPYHVYGGLQDNSSWVGDSSYPGGVSNSRLGKHVRRRRLLEVGRSVRPELHLCGSDRAARSAA